ncbi:glycosyltransferase [Psychroflexus montanilacus]|uniref:glycosyltransferase n=1 Tax=Psychroflexus montanilacus TaxID=2873598 RepID=UPI001CCE9736|nr:glycosyltransferase [Psychroflexus montanilacus]MBZ9652567.1 glycosyltransferase [Psychroflexus montanilacus]
MTKTKLKLVIGITSHKNTTLIKGQLAYFKNIGYKTYLLAPDHPQVHEYCNHEGCIHLSAPLEREISPFSDFKAIIVIYKHFKKIKPDVINLGTMKVSLTGMIAAYFAKVPYRIYTSRGFSALTETGFKKIALLASLKVISVLSHKVICISKSIKDNGIKYKMFKDNNTYVINKGSSNGVDLNLFSNKNINIDSKNKLRDSLNIMQNEFVFGYVGRLIDRKGINELYEAFNLCYKKNNSIKLLVVGPVEEIQLKKDKNIITKLQSHPGVILTGRINHKDVPLHMSIMDTFVLPAWWEGFGNVLIQAAAMGVPTISTFALGTQDAVSDNFNGELVPISYVDELEKVMIKFMESEKLREAYGKNGIKWSRNFEPEIIWKGMDRIYKKQFV